MPAKKNKSPKSKKKVKSNKIKPASKKKSVDADLELSAADEDDNFYFIEPDQPIEVTADPEFNQVKIEILAALDKRLPEKYFEPGLDWGQIDLAKIHEFSKTKKCIFEVVTIGNRRMKNLDGGSIRFFDTDPNQIACSLNFFVFSEEYDVYLGDILNILLERDEQKVLQVVEIDYLVESRFFEPSA